MRGLSILVTLCLFLTSAATAGTLSEQATLIETGARSLSERMGGADLTWGQKVAYDDMQRLANAAAALKAALPAEVDDVYTQLTELQVAGSRVKGSLVVARLDETGQKEAQFLLTQVQEVTKVVAEAREERDRRARRYSYGYGAPRFSIGIGFGSYYGYPYGYPYGYRPWGYGYGYPGFGYPSYIYGVRPACPPRPCR